MLLTAAFVFTYYTTWALILVSLPLRLLVVPLSQLGSMSYPSSSSSPLPLPHPTEPRSPAQPFLDQSSPIHALFPDRIWAVRLPLLLLLTGISGVALFFARVMFAEARKKRGAVKAA